MAWIEQQRRADGGLTARVIWRPGGARDATRVWETFGAGSDAQNLARADGFKRMVEAAGQRWPDGWVKGEGFVRPPDVADPMTPPPSFDKIGMEYVRQIVDLSPGQRKRYLGQLQLLARTPVRGSLIFAGPITAIGEAQLRTSGYPNAIRDPQEFRGMPRGRRTSTWTRHLDRRRCEPDSSALTWRIAGGIT